MKQLSGTRWAEMSSSCGCVCSLGKEQCCILNVTKSWQLNRKYLQPPGGQNIDDLSWFKEGLLVACTNSSQHSSLCFQSTFQLCFLLTAQHLLYKLQSLVNQAYPFLGSFLSKTFIFNAAPPHSSWVSHLLELNLQLSEIFLFPLIPWISVQRN